MIQRTVRKKLWSVFKVTYYLFLHKIDVIFLDVNGLLGIILKLCFLQVVFMVLWYLVLKTRFLHIIWHCSSHLLFIFDQVASIICSKIWAFIERNNFSFGWMRKYCGRNRKLSWTVLARPSSSTDMLWCVIQIGVNMKVPNCRGFMVY